MGQKREEEYEHHPAVDSLVSLFTKANHDLSVLHFKLDKEFQQIYPDNANPMKLVARIKKIQDELSSLKDQCRQLLAAKQDLIDKASSILVGNRSMVQRMQTSVGIPVTSDAEDTAFSSFNEWCLENLHHLPASNLYQFESKRLSRSGQLMLDQEQEMRRMMLCQRILTICCLHPLFEALNDGRVCTLLVMVVKGSKVFHKPNYSSDDLYIITNTFLCVFTYCLDKMNWRERNGKERNTLNVSHVKRFGEKMEHIFLPPFLSPPLFLPSIFFPLH